MLPMKNKRRHHFSIAVNDAVHVFGGEQDRGNSLVEIFDGKHWRLGPELPFRLNHYKGDNAVLLNINLILILTRGKGFIMYNPFKETISNVFDFKLKDDRTSYAAFFI